MALGVMQGPDHLHDQEAHDDPRTLGMVRYMDDIDDCLFLKFLMLFQWFEKELIAVICLSCLS